ncbi:MAG TPA: hypothetical protein VKK30_05655 [Actinomycetota bacterium]|nr:hypothetical protein [Actinomycetota bacterium]
MQIVPVVVVLGGVSWVVCALSVQSETDSPVFWRGRLGSAAHRASSGVGALWVRLPRARRSLSRQAFDTVRAMRVLPLEVGHGLVDAAASVREGGREDAGTISGWTKAGWEPVRRFVGPHAAVAREAVRARAPAAGRRLANLARRTLAKVRAATQFAHREASAAAIGARNRQVSFGESLSLTAVLGDSEEAFDLGPSADDSPHAVRGVVGLVLLIAVIGLAVAAGLMGLAWSLKHMIMRGQA